MRKTVLAMLVCAGLAACGLSPPTHFFTLDPIAGQTPDGAAAAAPIQVSAVHIPPALDQLSMVRETGANQLKIDDQNRWGAPLDDLARQVLLQDLMNRLPQGQVIPPDVPAPADARALVVNIIRFQPDASGTVTLDAVWTLSEGAPPKTLRRSQAHLTEPGGGDAAGQAAAMSRLLAALSGQIAKALSEPAGGQAPG